ncbi:MAG: hypothetical protein L0219_15195, partial [Phycisphaerales bacterium]|nr:hypothetical protein [Phycisphaerales bacterium]
MTGAATMWAQTYHAVATSKQIMAGIQKPAMDSLAAMMKAGGPADEKEWATAQQSAVILAESAQLLLIGDRPIGPLPKDAAVWTKTGNNLLTAANESAKAAEAKDVAAWKASLGS